MVSELNKGSMNRLEIGALLGVLNLEGMQLGGGLRCLLMKSGELLNPFVDAIVSAQFRQIPSELFKLLPDSLLLGGEVVADLLAEGAGSQDLLIEDS